jgi:hypothetical protein
VHKNSDAGERRRRRRGRQRPGGADDPDARQVGGEDGPAHADGEHGHRMQRLDGGSQRDDLGIERGCALAARERCARCGGRGHEQEGRMRAAGDAGRCHDIGAPAGVGHDC